MTGATFQIANQLNSSYQTLDLLLVTDMVNLPLLKSLLTDSLKGLPVIMYFHENQLTYDRYFSPQIKRNERDVHYGFINLCSAVAADVVVFNSEFHRQEFMSQIPSFLSRFPRVSFSSFLDDLTLKSGVIQIGVQADLPDLGLKNHEEPIFLWNHRWEHDKNPEEFFHVLEKLRDEGHHFRLIILGRARSSVPQVFTWAESHFKDQILHIGYADRSLYHQLLHQSNIIFSTSRQDFFGISVVEALLGGCYPILPDRLAFREHIPKGYWQEVIYNEGDALNHVRNVLVQKKYTSKITSDIQLYLQKYSWDVLGPAYDRLFEEAAKSQPPTFKIN